MKACHDNESGFSLYELLIVISIVVVLAAVSMPGLLRAIPNYRLKAAARAAVADLNAARQEAVTRNENMGIVFRQPLGDQVFDYLIFQDADSDLEFDSNEPVFRAVQCSRHQGIGLDIDSTSFARNDENLKSVAFNSRGLPISNSGGMGMGSVSLKNNNGRQARVVMNGMGRVRVELQ